MQFNIIIQQNFYQQFQLLPRPPMPSSKNKKNSEKTTADSLQPFPDKGLNKIKFNISMDNLRPFVEGGESARTARKRSRYSELQEEKQKKTVKTEESKEYPSVDRIKREAKSPDISREVSNEILKKIEANGIKFHWKEVEELKSEWCDDDDWTNRQVWTERSYRQDIDPQPQPQHQYPNPNHPSSHPDKNPSFASTTQPCSHYYQPEYSYQLLDYSSMRQLALDYFSIQAENIGHDQRTTLMIKNIPNKYTIQFLAEQIDRQHANTYDFLYLPCDIKNNCNVGYGFINFLNTDVLKRFYNEFHSKRWGKFKSEKICNLTYARLQGLQNLIQHFQNSKVLNHKDKKYQPIIREFSSINHLIKEQKSKSTQQA